MTEERYEVKTYKALAKCKCGGQMRPTGVVLTMYPPLFPHVCEMCGEGENLTDTYPKIEHEIIVR